jgi:hypothetical protein
MEIENIMFCLLLIYIIIKLVKHYLQTKEEEILKCSICENGTLEEIKEHTDTEFDNGFLYKDIKRRLECNNCGKIFKEVYKDNI